jgi:lantibiotic modifying enzyme
MDSFYDRLTIRAATIDELLSDDFETLPGQKGDADLAAKRLAAWCRACASGDWPLFGRRLERDNLSVGQVLARFATARRRAAVSRPAWIDDAIWIEEALESASEGPALFGVARYPFDQLFTPVVEQAEARLWASAGRPASDRLNASARAGLRRLLLDDLCRLCAPAVYQRFAKAREAGPSPAGAAQLEQEDGTAHYDQFIVQMKTGGLRRLFEDKPVLLRLISMVTRQWLVASGEFVTRLDADLAAIRRDILHSGADSLVAKIEGGISDPHNSSHAVLIIELEDGSRFVYKPKDLRTDVTWHALIERMNRAGAPVELKAARAIAREGYGWTEYIAHAGCTDAKACKRFFRRAGAWLELFHCFAGTDMHQENMIAAGDHPVPIDLETILQAAAEEQAAPETEAQAFEAAKEVVANSVMAVGLLPAYGRSADNDIFMIGGVASDWTSGTKLAQQLLRPDAATAPTQEIFRAEADNIAEEISRHAVRRGAGAAWIGLSWLSDSEVSQLTVLGPDLYNGACGIAVFLAAHAMATEGTSSAGLALAAISHLRKSLRGRNAARMARSLGIGGATGLGSIVYALTVMSEILHDGDLLGDAHRAAELFSDDLIASDTQLDVIAGSAGAILGLLRLHRDTQSDDVLRRALKCGEHLLAQPRVGPKGRRSWRGRGPNPHVLNGMSHGPAGFAYALASLAAATRRQDFADAASECIAFENSSYDVERTNWPDFREAEPHWRSQWCHGAIGIGLARIAMMRTAGLDSNIIAADIRNALAGAELGWPGHVDTLCCGALGSVEFFCEAAAAVGRSGLRDLAARRMMAVVQSGASKGDYRWNGGARRFNLGLFRGLAGVGYTCLRQITDSLPNILIWE